MTCGSWCPTKSRRNLFYCDKIKDANMYAQLKTVQDINMIIQQESSTATLAVCDHILACLNPEP